MLKTTTGRTSRLRLKIDFDTDLTPNITRHFCIISAELVVSSFINNLVRLSSIVPFHIIYQVNLYWRNNTAHKYNYFETLWLSILTFPAFSTPAIWSRIFMSCIFHPCKLLPQIHVSHFQSPPLQNELSIFGTHWTKSLLLQFLWTVSKENCKCYTRMDHFRGCLILLTLRCLSMTYFDAFSHFRNVFLCLCRSCRWDGGSRFSGCPSVCA